MIFYDMYNFNDIPIQSMPHHALRNENIQKFVDKFRERIYILSM